MKIIEIPIFNYIDIDEEKIDLWINTKDKRMMVVKDIHSNPVFDGQALYIDHMFLDNLHTFVMLQEDFASFQYRITPRNTGEFTKENHNSLHTYIEEDYLEDFETSMGSGYMNGEVHMIEDLI